MSQQPFEINVPDFVRKGFFVWLFLIATFLFGLVTSVYKVETEYEGVILRFGKAQPDKVRPGLRFKLPFGIDEVLLEPVERQLKQEYGFGTEGATDQNQFADRRTWDDVKRMVTGDLNAVEVEWSVQYQIDEQADFLFTDSNPKETLRNLSESVMRTVVGDRTVDDCIVRRSENEKEAKKQLNKLVKDYGLGIVIENIQFKRVVPPQEVFAAFEEVNSAEQIKVGLVNTALKEYNDAVPLAVGQKEQKILLAQGYASERVNKAMGDVARFNALLAEFEKAPEIMRTRLYLETMSEVVPKLGRKIIIDEDASQILPLLQLQTSGKGGLSR
jgi:membrane protease subunit HflK